MANADAGSATAPTKRFPIPIPGKSSKAGFTTSTTFKDASRGGVASNIRYVPLDDGADKALGVHKVTTRTTHNIVEPPAPTSSLLSSRETPESRLPFPERAWEAFYPKGSINPSGAIAGGFGFYLSGPGPNGSGATGFREHLEQGAKEVVTGYRVMFEKGWEWKKGGKLPGIFGGVGDLAYGCTGGRQDKRCQCFDLRPMWRQNGLLELYTYLPLTQNNATRLLAVPPESKANSDYGYSVGRGAGKLDIGVGNWVTIAIRIKMNELGKEDGEIEMFLDGRSIIHADKLTICEAKEGRIRGMHFQTFFGGHTDDWASPKDQRAWFADISGIVIG